ncbi:MAG: 50S ribosomal protein L15 [Pseudomonadota bacterium]|nr:50S ribosomal protein L15 [Pseudomonadota bacterium]
MRLNQLSDNVGAVRRSKRVGRGPGSGKGKTGGRGMKGQKSRSGVAIKGYEGGQMPIYMRLPKRGFSVRNPKRYAVINLGVLQKFIENKKIDIKEKITEEVLVSCGLVTQKRDGVRLLAKGEITSKVDLSVTGASKAAINAVKKAGGSITVSSQVAK